MFRRSWAGLPPDRRFQPDLKELGYFVNDTDEIRLIQNDKYYFNYFLTKSARVNHCQRFAMHTVLRQIVLQRLESEGVHRLLLPPGATESVPHVPVLASDDLSTCARVVLVVGEPLRNLGVFAPRVCFGPGGITAGCVIPLLRRLRTAPSTAVVVANPGELWWWPDGGRTLNSTDVLGVPLPSAVHLGHAYDPAVNAVPGHEDARAHLRRVFADVLATKAAPHARIDIIAVADGAHYVQDLLDQPDFWAAWGHRLNALVLVASCYGVARLQNPELRLFLQQRARAFICSEEPLGMLLSDPHGNLAHQVEPFGCPVFSGGESLIDEMVILSAMPDIADWLDTVAATEDYRNPELEIEFYSPEQTEPAEATQDVWVASGASVWPEGDLQVKAKT